MGLMNDPGLGFRVDPAMRSGVNPGCGDLEKTPWRQRPALDMRHKVDPGIGFRIDPGMGF